MASPSEVERVTQLLAKVKRTSADFSKSLERQLDAINNYNRVAKCSKFTGQILGLLGWLITLVTWYITLFTNQDVNTEKMHGHTVTEAIIKGGLILMFMGVAILCISDIIYLDILINAKIKKEVDPLLVMLKSSVIELKGVTMYYAPEIQILSSHSETMDIWDYCISKPNRFVEFLVAIWRLLGDCVTTLLETGLQMVFGIVLLTCILVVARMLPFNLCYEFKDIKNNKKHPTAAHITECIIPNLEEQIRSFEERQQALMSRTLL